MEGWAACPFCGSTDLGVLMSARRHEGRQQAAVVCKKCSARGPIMETSYCEQTSKGPIDVTEKAHRTIWNRRTATS
jgi:Lar family restriction alleviation protein